MVWGWLKRTFSRSGNEYGAVLVEGSKEGPLGENSAYDPSVARKGDSIDWVEAGDNPWGVRVLDVRPITHTMILVSGIDGYASNAISWTGDDGTSFIGEEPPDASSVKTDLRFPIDRYFAEGVLFVPVEMEHKWAIFYHRREIICVDSWQRKVLVVARVEEHDDHILITEVRGTFFGLESVPDFTERALDYLLRRHSLNVEYPAPLPAGMEQIPKAAADWCMFTFGNRATCATPHQIVRQDPETPLRTNSLLHIAVARGDVPEIEAQIASGVPLDVLALDGLTPFHWAQSNEMRDTLLKLGFAVDSPSNEGVTSLMITTQLANIDGMSYLIDHGADVDARDHRGGTALHRAAELVDLDVLRLLLDRGASQNIEALGHTPRSFAESRGNEEILAVFDEYNSDSNLGNS